MWDTILKEEVLRKLDTDKKTGITEKEAEKRKMEYGKNILEEGKREKFLIKLIKQFKDFMISVLIIASIISAGVSYFKGENDYIDSIIIIAIVFLNALMGVIQEEKAEKSIESLKKLTPLKTKVIRNNKEKEVNAEELVPGDIIILESGNYVPADCRLLESYELKVEESSLTGENEPILKNSEIICKKGIPIGDKINMVFMTGIIISGHAKAVVVETGMNTKVGNIANMIIEEDAPKTPIQVKLEKVGKSLGMICLTICVLIFFIGLIRKIEPMEMFMTSVGLAVAAIPEGLPAIVTIVLSIGVTKMAKSNSIIRKLPAVETLGCTKVICSDKTGTLTQNKMTVKKIISMENNKTLEFATMCTNCSLKTEKGKIKILGEPTEVAIVEKAIQEGIDKNILNQNMPRVYEIPFDSKRKRMTTIHKNGNGYRIITKGAPDVIIEKCKLGFEKKEKVIKDNYNMAKEALRVLAVGYKDIEELPKKIDYKEIENGLNFLGLIGMMDPPREGVKEAVRTCKNAGIKIVMITGDHLETAKSIARELNILGKYDKAIEGKDLDIIGKDKLKEIVNEYTVFARVTPEHKVRIVKAFQDTGAIVAMTGDGVNDSPALKNADIGIAMGKTGTDVAKNAADMILADDNFVTIVEAVKQGRNIYDNIRKAIHFLIATNIGEIVTIFMGLILGMKTPLLAIQLLWINLVTDSFPAIAIGLEKPEIDIMKRKPIDSRKGIFSDGLWTNIIVEGVMIGMLTLISFSIGNKYFGLKVGRTMAFVSMGILELVHSFNIKSERSLFELGFSENKFLVVSLVVGVFIQTIVVMIPKFANIFDLIPLNNIEWIIVAIISILPIPIMEIQKKVNSFNLENILKIESIKIEK